MIAAAVSVSPAAAPAPAKPDATRDEPASASADLGTRRETPVMVSAATQWSLHDAQSQLLKRASAAAPHDRTLDDPVMARAVVTELHKRIETLEREKQDVEDRLIDLRFSLSAEPASAGKLHALGRRLKVLIGSGGGVKPCPARAALTRPESLRAALVKRQVAAGGCDASLADARG
jgi:hypothetical protein